LRENATQLRVEAEAIGTISGQRKQSRMRAARSEKQADELAPRDDDDDEAGGSGGTQLPLHQVPTTPEGKPVEKAQRNFTDADSRIITRNGVFMQAYSAQTAVSEDQDHRRPRPDERTAGRRAARADARAHSRELRRDADDSDRG
jgi:hypothetical protein